MTTPTCVDCSDSKIVGDGYPCPTCADAPADGRFSGPILQAMEVDEKAAPERKIIPLSRSRSDDMPAEMTEATAMPEPTPTDTTPAAPRQDGEKGGILYNKHDADKLQDECEALVRAINGNGALLDIPRLRATAESYAAVQLLVNKGICTEYEAQASVFLTMRSLLTAALQQTEEQKLRASKPQVEVAKAPGLVVARH